MNALFGFLALMLRVAGALAGVAVGFLLTDAQLHQALLAAGLEGQVNVQAARIALHGFAGILGYVVMTKVTGIAFNTRSAPPGTRRQAAAAVPRLRRHLVEGEAKPQSSAVPQYEDPNPAPTKPVPVSFRELGLEHPSASEYPEPAGVAHEAPRKDGGDDHLFEPRGERPDSAGSASDEWDETPPPVTRAMPEPSAARPAETRPIDPPQPPAPLAFETVAEPEPLAELAQAAWSEPVPDAENTPEWHAAVAQWPEEVPFPGPRYPGDTAIYGTVPAGKVDAHDEPTPEAEAWPESMFAGEETEFSSWSGPKEQTAEPAAAWEEGDSPPDLPRSLFGGAGEDPAEPDWPVEAEPAESEPSVSAIEPRPEPDAIATPEHAPEPIPTPQPAYRPEPVATAPTAAPGFDMTSAQPDWYDGAGDEEEDADDDGAGYGSLIDVGLGKSHAARGPATRPGEAGMPPSLLAPSGGGGIRPQGKPQDFRLREALDELARLSDSSR
ncbi:hypothetical protein [Croceicoccus naphthovorans]|uniref:Uncharacterized protein n=1 Tax=Croceicoccus naphthovorans TaxID=1348774 RepID=A0A0G3XI82_9SPHN|nr:hypothetical protein [Croceicoccus naphthovorans]AKM11280.1 hypothetical protein AB433_16935 [Croceicoccus naphthovorans]MBB3989802.1 hypothetical protein [Croceicoccus naphthovorans]